MHQIHDQCKQPCETQWAQILDVLSTNGSEETRVLRVLLFMLLHRDSSSMRERFSCRRKLWRWLAGPARRDLPQATKGCPLFAFIFDTPSNINNLLPVLGAAERRGWRAGILTGDRVELDSTRLSGASACVSVKELMGATTLRERFTALTHARQLYRALCAHCAGRAPGLARAIRRHPTLIVTELALSLAARPALRRLYAAWQPSCLVSTTDLWPFEHVVYAEARRAGIPSFVIQHGTPDHYWWPAEADCLLLWGEMFRRELLDWGAAGERLAVAGMPASDHLSQRQHARREKQQGARKPSYLILSQAWSHIAGLPAAVRSFLKAIVPATPGIKWVVKLHPNERDAFYRALGDGVFRSLTILPKSTTLEEAVGSADVVCALYSTAALEAMMMRRPVIILNVVPAIAEAAWWPKHGGGTYVPTVQAMIDFVGKTLSDQQFLGGLVTQQDKFVAESFANPGRASEAILDRIEAVLERPTQASRSTVSALPDEKKAFLS